MLFPSTLIVLISLCSATVVPVAQCDSSGLTQCSQSYDFCQRHTPSLPCYNVMSECYTRSGCPWCVKTDCSQKAAVCSLLANSLCTVHSTSVDALVTVFSVLFTPCSISGCESYYSSSESGSGNDVVNPWFIAGCGINSDLVNTNQVSWDETVAIEEWSVSIEQTFITGKLFAATNVPALTSVVGASQNMLTDTFGLCVRQFYMWIARDADAASYGAAVNGFGLIYLPPVHRCIMYINSTTSEPLWQTYIPLVLSTPTLASSVRQASISLTERDQKTSVIIFTHSGALPTAYDSEHIPLPLSYGPWLAVPGESSFLMMRDSPDLKTCFRQCDGDSSCQGWGFFSTKSGFTSCFVVRSMAIPWTQLGSREIVKRQAGGNVDVSGFVVPRAVGAIYDSSHRTALIGDPQCRQAPNGHLTWAAGVYSPQSFFGDTSCGDWDLSLTWEPLSDQGFMGAPWYETTIQRPRLWRTDTATKCADLILNVTTAGKPGPNIALNPMVYKALGQDPVNQGCRALLSIQVHMPDTPITLFKAEHWHADGCGGILSSAFVVQLSELGLFWSGPSDYMGCSEGNTTDFRSMIGDDSYGFNPVMSNLLSSSSMPYGVIVRTGSN